MAELYTTEVLRWTTRIPHLERLDGDGVQHVTKTSRVCGSRINADAVVKDGVIIAYGQEVKACALGQAAAAIVGQHIVGLTAEELADVAARFKHMVKTGEADFSEKWADLTLLAPVFEHPGRHGSVMLPFDVLEAVFTL